MLLTSETISFANFCCLSIYLVTLYEVYSVRWEVVTEGRTDKDVEGGGDDLLAVKFQFLCRAAWWSPRRTLDSQHLDQGSKLGPSEYEVGLLTA
jgi:hypothetical protein